MHWELGISDQVLSQTPKELSVTLHGDESELFAKALHLPQAGIRVLARPKEEADESLNCYDY